MTEQHRDLNASERPGPASHNEVRDPSQSFKFIVIEPTIRYAFFKHKASE
jgi:hypothetical protein